MVNLTNNQKVIGLVLAQVIILAVLYGVKHKSTPNQDGSFTREAPIAARAPEPVNVPLQQDSPVSASKNGISQLDGAWYSPQWKYGYELKNGIGTATSTNSVNFSVGDKIINLAPAGKDMFEGVQVYKDGNFYKVTATLLPDGRLYFQGEKNVSWYMERVGSQRVEAPVRAPDPVVQQPLNSWTFLESNGNSMTYYNPKSIERSGRLVGVVTVVTYPYPSKVFFSNVKVGSFTQNMVFRCDRGVYNVVRVAAYSDPMGQGDQLPTNPIDTAREWPVTGGFVNIYNQYCR